LSPNKRHAPRLNLPWRLWYRIEKLGDTNLGE
jgi:hypothetical protein